MLRNDSRLSTLEDQNRHYKSRVLQHKFPSRESPLVTISMTAFREKENALERDELLSADTTQDSISAEVKDSLAGRII